MRWLQVRESGLPAADGRASGADGGGAAGGPGSAAARACAEGVPFEVLDVRAERRSQDRARRRERRLLRVESLARVGTWEWDIASGQVLWSDQLLALFGLQSGEELRFEQYQSLLHPPRAPHSGRHRRRRPAPERRRRAGGMAALPRAPRPGPLVARVLGLGGTAVQQPADLRPVSGPQLCTDRGGAPFAVVPDGQAVTRPGLGRPSWYELMTADPAGSDAFYRAAFGSQTACPPGVPAGTDPAEAP